MWDSGGFFEWKGKIVFFVVLGFTWEVLIVSLDDGDRIDLFIKVKDIERGL